ncbi:MAG: phosphate signaling complex protein PhoU [Oscillospiraceae bacterium]
MRNKFETQLELLNNELITMGALCESAIASAVKAFTTKDETLTKKTIECEKEIDHKEREIESLCLKLLLQQQPVAKDLRLISSALKMITDMERIGDQAADIAEIVPFITISQNSIVYEHIENMAKEAIKMVTQSLDAFVKSDLELTTKVMKYDDTVDSLFVKVKTDLMEIITKGNGNGEEALDMLMIAKYLERIGDHAVNIAEWVEFSITGEHK